ncbi:MULTISPECIES: tripartite tricarboxylate transporter substrate-binding protein [unclassified Comamonas]|uniref:Tripartite tricarboxylate transporter substrate-binding protein n=2 Tax=Comamonadaceae TaxID=80864 RepID=A0ABY5ZUF7_9BURK|nr:MULTISPECIES: tripartite tricarboxylate transporter substrate-binding protein [unclassified Comamonas]PWB18146.1 ABC transporter substrate-binding protein [Comamonas sp. JNW]UXC17605.1 tripartite tricarboxylate transporter substrate-binding protein [Comamonas sp. PR12]
MLFSRPRRKACLGLLALAASMAAGAQAAAHYPTKAITLVIAYPPGGSTDAVGRMVGTELAQRLKQPVVIENLGGAGGAIGAQKVARAPADGYTLLLSANNEMAIAPLINKAIKYRVFKDFTPISLVATQPMVLVASQSSGVKNTQEFLSLLRQNPGKYSYGSSGVGTALHIAGEMVQQAGNVAMTHVPYKGVAPLTNDLLGGSLDFGVFVLSSGLPHIRAGKVVALGTTEAKRSSVTPDIPALAETSAFARVDINSWFALMGPAKLPPQVQKALRAAIDDMLQSPSFRAKLEASGNVVAAPGQDMGAFLKAQVSKYQQIVETAKIEDR